MNQLIRRLSSRAVNALDVAGAMSAIALLVIYIAQGGHL